MNERIRQLMIDAGYAEPDMAARAKYLAELIIKECYDVVMTGDRYRREYFADKIKKHFGMEEGMEE